MYTCPHTAVGLAVLKKLVRAGTISKSQRVVCISTAHGLKFTEFKVRYHESQLEGLLSNRANPAVLLAPEYDAVMAAIRKRLTSRSLVSLIGPGGVGKTRLAIRAASESRRGFPQGSWLVELADVHDDALLSNAVMVALGLRDQTATQPAIHP